MSFNIIEIYYKNMQKNSFQVEKYRLFFIFNIKYMMLTIS
ncbi:hypothetical protein CWS_00420 [Buchnera aphidicola str. JF99 (Acyrthosiphon pisum)]|nr:hypothetical protein CWO_00405 [Buchnera aphidicola str. LL01 (Acyrthosiphon pisum)]ADP66483.1 hypothetical protein CWQ_00435 [Buchnera aphidicola str. TLW03 (Acyrthosiphon pisum)]ADP67061.1 hypothetical protein CWS_00420 [Buchnera aphidicola str. JF99 (Acyrthosiphon pisum)]